MQVDFSGAVADYSLALCADPTLSAALYNRGTVHYRLGRFELALVDFERACHHQPENQEFREGLRACQRDKSNTNINK